MKTALLFAFVLSGAPALAQTIDFELVPGVGVPDRPIEISDQFAADFGVSFGLVDRDYVPGTGVPAVFGTPNLALVGGTATAFIGVRSGNCADRVRDQARVGRVFLTDNRDSSTLAGNLLISYLVPVESASGDILDVDARNAQTANVRFEEWRVFALDENYDVVPLVQDAVLRAPDGAPAANACQDRHGPGDGEVVRWRVESRAHRFEIHHILLAYTGDAGEVGLAFDNFTPSSNECTGGWETLGAPCNDDARLVGTRCFKPGQTIRLAIEGGLPGAHGFVFGSPTRGAAMLDGCPLYPALPLAFAAPHVLDASGAWAREYTVPLGLIGTEYFVQAFHMLPQGGCSFTNGLRGTVVP